MIFITKHYLKYFSYVGLGHFHLELFSFLKKRNQPKIRIYNRGTRETTQVPDDLQHYLCVAAIVKNEGDYLAEWVEFHHMLGVEKFLIYDNGSTDNINSVLQPYINEGLLNLSRG